MTGRPDTTDPLDRIEAVARTTVEAWGTNAYAQHVLALVAVARAARPMAELPYPLSADERQQWLIRQNQLRDALARLDGAR